MGRPRTKKLAIAPGIRLDASEFVEAATAVIGKRKSGKSGTVKVIAEQLYKAGLPFVILDPVGIHYGLKSSFDGKKPGLSVVVVGGKFQDLPLNRQAGAEIAKAVVDANMSVVIDLSEESKAVFRQFARDFCHTLFALNNSPRVVIIEEAPELVPQKLRPDLTEVFEAVERLVSRGRNKLIGVVLVSQRVQTINKDVLSQIDLLIVGRLVAPQDRKALGEWVDAHDVEDQLPVFAAGLASLKTREFWFWAPEAFGGIFQKGTVYAFETLHGDKTHIRKMGLLETKPVTTDVTPVIARLGAAIAKIREEKADASQVPALRQKIAQLERALKAPIAVVQAAPGPNLKNDLLRANQRIAELEQRGKTTARALHSLQTWAEGYVRHVGGYVERHPMPAFEKPATTPISVNVGPTFPGGVEVIHHDVPEPAPERGVPPPAPDNGSADPGKLVAGERRILSALIWKSPLTRKQLATLAGLSPKSGGYANYLGRLKKLDYMRQQGDSFWVTETGRWAIPANERIDASAFSHEELVRIWMEKLVGGERRMLQALVDRYPEGISRDDLAAAAELSAASGGFANYVGHLRGNDLIVRDSDGLFRASPTLWPEQN